MSDVPTVTAAEAVLDDRLLLPTPTERLAVGDVLTVVDLDAGAAASAAERLGRAHRVLVGIAHRPVQPAAEPLLGALTLTLSAVEQPGRAHVRVDDPDTALTELVNAVDRTPRAALVLAGLLRLASALPVPDALVAESLAFSTLLAGPEFARWRLDHPPRPVPPDPPDAVLLDRAGGTLLVTLNRPDRRNALGRAMRDQLIDALAVAEADPSVTAVELCGAGPHFCSGGDLDEFGTAADPATAHAVRLARSAGAAVHRSADRVRVHLHGACVGAGVEVPAFAGRLLADPDAYFALPELSLGLVPGAGGTVSLPARIGRWRTAWMALTGERVTAPQALAWGLVDEVTTDG